MQMFKVILPKYPKAAFVDIGAHMGIYTVSAAKLGHRVFAFEPNKETWKYLTGSVAVNNLQTNVSLFAYALMDKRHHCVRLSTPARDNIGHTIVQVEKNESLAECQDESKSIKVALLDDLVPHFHKHGLTQAVIKIDVEASEPKVFLGGQNFFKKIHVPNIMMEIDQMRQRFISGTHDEKLLINGLLDQMTSLGYVAVPIGMPVSKSLSRTNFRYWPVDVVWHLNRTISN
ncbi:uncharacterized protein LOC142354774 isoform X2 [Convolutriloba macropyga]